MTWNTTMKEIRENNAVFIDLQDFTQLNNMFKIIGDSLQVDVDSEGNWEITDSSIR